MRSEPEGPNHFFVATKHIGRATLAFLLEKISQIIVQLSDILSGFHPHPIGWICDDGTGKARFGIFKTHTGQLDTLNTWQKLKIVPSSLYGVRIDIRTSDQTLGQGSDLRIFLRDDFLPQLFIKIREEFHPMIVAHVSRGNPAIVHSRFRQNGSTAAHGIPQRGFAIPS